MRTSFSLGFDYYPEHWPEKRWETDLEMMRECGTTCIRIAEFAWSRMEPREGEFTFDWLDRFMQLTEKYDISVILGTPTAAPPPWVWQNYPDSILVQNDGKPASTTWRRYVCPTSPNYLSCCDRIVEEMVRHYGNHKKVIGWQTDNEINGAVCCCRNCQEACRDWLREKYGTLKELNVEQGRVFWSHEVTDWDQVILPRPGVETKRTNPSVRRDVLAFSSDAWREFTNRQIRIIRKHSPDRWITHNLPGHGVNLDLYKFAEVHDFISMDDYPKAMIDPRSRGGLRNDLTRSLQNRPHWIMEIQTGTPCTKFYKAPVPRQGQLSVWAHQAAAHGAEGVVFFRWRKSPVGAEMFGNGMLNHDGKPRRQYREIKSIGEQFRKLADNLPAYSAPPEIAIIFDYADRSNARIHNFTIDVDFFGHIEQWWQSANDLGLNVQLVRSTDDLAPFATVITPNQFTTSPEIVANLTEYVTNGGTLIGMNRMGIFDKFGKPSCLTLPGGMTELFGIEIEEYERAMEPNPNRIIFDEEIGENAECFKWNYYLNDLTARPLATYEKDFYAGRTAISENKFGSGNAVYIGTMLDDKTRKRLLGILAVSHRLSTLPGDWPGDVERIKLTTPEGHRVWALINHGVEPRNIELPSKAVDLISGDSSTQIVLKELSAKWIRF